MLVYALSYEVNIDFRKGYANLYMSQRGKQKVNLCNLCVLI